MSDGKWIKMSTDLFDNRKIKQIEAMPDGDSLVVIWLKLLILAGEINDGGAVYFTRNIPYTDQLLATQFNRPLATIQLALQTFQRFGMIEITENILQITNWEKYQNVEGLDKVREQNRLRNIQYRERKRLAASNNSDTPCDDDTPSRVTSRVTSRDATEKEREEEREEDYPPIIPPRGEQQQQHFSPSPASAREESAGTVENPVENYDPALVITVAKYFETEYMMEASLEEAEKFVAWNAATGGKIRDWRKAADLWVTRIKEHNKDGKGWMDV